MKLRTDNIKKSYKGRQVVKGVSVEVNQGEIVGLLGPNGAGKTTSFYMIVGLVSPNEGKVYLDDLEITRHAMYKRAQLGIGYLPQEVSVFRKMTVEDNIMTVLEMTSRSKQERADKLESLLDEFGLQHVRKNLGQSLSGGEKRRTEIARALATNPKFILLDEPFAGVDPIAVEDIQQIVAKLKKKNIGVLITDHNVQETLSITDRTYLLFEGSILREGTAEALASDEMVRKVYLGANFELRKKVYGNESAANDAPIKNISQDEKDINYVSNTLNLVKRIKNNVKAVSIIFLDRKFADSTGLLDLINTVQEFKEHFEKKAFGNRTTEILRNLNLGPSKKYSQSNYQFILKRYTSFIPVYGWIVAYIYWKRKKKAIDDLELLEKQLDSLLHLLRHPALEKMI